MLQVCLNGAGSRAGCARLPLPPRSWQQKPARPSPPAPRTSISTPRTSKAGTRWTPPPSPRPSQPYGHHFADPPPRGGRRRLAHPPAGRLPTAGHANRPGRRAPATRRLDGRDHCRPHPRGAGDHPALIRTVTAVCSRLRVHHGGSPRRTCGGGTAVHAVVTRCTPGPRAGRRSVLRGRGISRAGPRRGGRPRWRGGCRAGRAG